MATAVIQQRMESLVVCTSKAMAPGRLSHNQTIGTWINPAPSPRLSGTNLPGNLLIKRRLALAGLLAITALGGCIAAPRMGSPSLARLDSPLLSPRALDVIERQLRDSIVFSACSDIPRGVGPAASLDATLIPSDEYEQEGRRAQALIQPYRFTIGLTSGPGKGAIMQVTAPAGFVSDFHSTPDAAVGITLSIRKALEAAVVHDWLYAIGRHGDEAQRELADQVYSDILAHYGVDEGTNWTVSTAIRWDGAKNFGAASELRFYNKCFYGGCAGEIAPSPVAALPAPILTCGDNFGI